MGSRSIEDKLHVVALRSEELGNNGILDYHTLLNKMQSLDSNLQGMRIFTNHIATIFKQYLSSGMPMKQALAKIKQTNQGTHINSLLYCETYSVQLNTTKYRGYVTIYTNPAIPYIPSLRIILRYPTKKCLRIFERLFPTFLVSKAEFTLDIVCESASDTRTLFEYIMRHLYMPRRKKNSLKSIGDHGNRVDVKLTTNHAFRISHLKIYERGPDSKRKKLANGKYGWDATDIDRIRIEFDITNAVMRGWGAKVHVIERGKRKLRLVLLGDFLNSTDINPMQYLNIAFKSMKNLWKGSIFLSTYLSSTTANKRSMIDCTRLKWLSDGIASAVDRFVQMWRQDICKIVVQEESASRLDIEDDHSIFDTREDNMRIEIPKTKEQLIEQGKVCLQQANARKALKLFMKIDESECSADMFNELFSCRSAAHFLLKQYEQALINLECVTKHDAAYFCNKGIIQGKLDRKQEALQAYDEALRIDPEDVGTYLNRGQLYGYEMLEHGLAIQDFEYVLASKQATDEDREFARLHIMQLGLEAD